jgi:hypothetical protein
MYTGLGKMSLRPVVAAYVTGTEVYSMGYIEVFLLYIQEHVQRRSARLRFHKI